MPDGLEKSGLEKKWESEIAAENALSDTSPDSEATPEDAHSGAGDPTDPYESLVKERDDLKDQLLRARAEFDNYRKRVARDAERTRKMAAESLIRDLLPIVDNIELALNHKDSNPEALAEGVEMVAKLFHETLKNNGLEPIGAEGQMFDPELHDAMMRQPDDSVPADTVLQEFQKGYRIGDVVLRHAKVVVSAAPETTGRNDDANSGATAGESAQAEE